MHTDTKQQEWKSYCTRMLSELSPVLAKHGYKLEAEQPHIIGERSLTRPLAGGRKLVLIGRRMSDQLRVVIKASDEPRGNTEIEEERECRDVLEKIKFAYRTFFSPSELAFLAPREAGGFTILITEFIEQEIPFLARPLEEQFEFALAAFKAQEGAHATAHAHFQLIKKAFGEQMHAGTYCEKIQQYAQDALSLIPINEAVYAELDTTTNDAITFLASHTETLERYGDFLTHWDFMPQNFRIRDGKLYLLDHSSIRFGNKYESWARFINFMVLHNPPLADALLQYVKDNRTPEESLALKLMRVYRTVELIRYYASWLSQTEGDLHTLAKIRIAFWTEVLRAVLGDTTIPPHLVEKYRTERDALRSPEEKQRQKNLH